MAPVVRDSAGVRVVEYPATLPSPPVSVDLVWEHGQGEEDYGYQYVSSGAVQPDGGAILADGGNREVVVIAADGASHRLLAGTGQGPEEVMGPREIVASGPDGVWVEDPVNGKLLKLENGEPTTTVNTIAAGIPAYSLMPVAESGGGDLLMVPGGYRTDFEEPWLNGYLIRFSPAEGWIDTVGSYPMVPRAPETGVNPFGPSGVITGAGHDFVHARTDVAELIWRDADGDTTQIVRWVPVMTYPTETMWEEFKTMLRANLARVNPSMSAASLEGFVEEQIARYAVNESEPLPLFGRIVGGSQGDVWLPESASWDVGSKRYTVVSADGISSAVATFDRPVSILSVNEEFVLGTSKNELDVQAVVLYRYAVGQ
jgi:hypothetical protein